LWARIQRTLELGPFAGPIYTIILIVDCLFFLFLEWWAPREDIDYVTHEFKEEIFRKCMKEMESGEPTNLEEVIDQSAIITVPELLKVVNTH
jgi:phosphatidylinositol glycan class A protein